MLLGVCVLLSVPCCGDCVCEPRWVVLVLLWLLRELPFVLTELLLSEPVPVVVLVEL